MQGHLSKYRPTSILLMMLLVSMRHQAFSYASDGLPFYHLQGPNVKQIKSVANTTNYIAIYGNEVYQLVDSRTQTILGTGRYRSDMENQYKVSSALQIPGTSFFMIATGIIGKGLSIVDVQVFSVQTCVGGCILGESIGEVALLGSGLYLTGDILTVMLLQDKSMISKDTSYSSVSLISTIDTEYDRFTAHDYLLKRTMEFMVEATGSFSINLEYTSLSTIALGSLSIFKQFNLLLSLSISAVMALDRTTGALKWSLSNTDIFGVTGRMSFDFCPSQYILTIWITNIAMSASIRQILDDSSVPPQILSHSMSDLIKSAAHTADGKTIMIGSILKTVVLTQTSACDLKCKVCSYLDDSYCLACISGYALSSPGLCVHCHSECAECSNSTRKTCLSCPLGTTLTLSNTCCHPSCLTCSGPSQAQCSACHLGYELQAGQCTQVVAGLTPAACAADLLAMVDGECVDCSLSGVYERHRQACEIDPYIRAVNWTVSGKWHDSSYSMLDVTISHSWSDSILNAVKYDIFSIEIDDVKSKVVKHLNDAIYVQVQNHVDRGNSLRVAVLNTGSRNENLIGKKKGISYILMRKSEDFQMTIPLEVSDKFKESYINLIESMQSASNFMVKATFSVALLGSTLSVNVFPAFIKMFLIIEIIGKFYFAPIEFSPIMDTSLKFVQGLSDLVSTPPGLLIDEPAQDRTTVQGKLTKYKQQRYILRATPIMYIFFVFLYIVVAICKRIWPHPKKILAAVFKVTNSLKNVAFDLNLVDFMFFSTYALSGHWPQQGYSPRMIMNQFSANLMISEIILVTLRSYEVALQPGIRVSKSEIWADSASSYNRDSEYKKEVLGHLKVKLITPFFLTQLVAYQVIIVSTQNASYLGLIILVLGTVAMAGFYLHVLLVYSPYSSVVASSQNMAYYLSLAIFVVVISLKRVEVGHEYMDLATVGLIAVCIIVEFAGSLVLVVRIAIWAVRKLCQKRKSGGRVSAIDLGQSTMSRRSPESPFKLTTAPKRLTGQLKNSEQSILSSARSRIAHKADVNKSLFGLNMSRRMKISVKVKKLDSGAEKFKKELRKIVKVKANVKGNSEQDILPKVKI